MTLPSLFSESDLHAISQFFPGEAATGKPQNKQKRKTERAERSRTDARPLPTSRSPFPRNREEEGELPATPKPYFPNKLRKAYLRRIRNY